LLYGTSILISAFSIFTSSRIMFMFCKLMSVHSWYHSLSSDGSLKVRLFYNLSSAHGSRINLARFHSQYALTFLLLLLLFISVLLPILFFPSINLLMSHCRDASSSGICRLEILNRHILGSRCLCLFPQSVHLDNLHTLHVHWLKSRINKSSL
jgi:hypothetical protein